MLSYLKKIYFSIFRFAKTVNQSLRRSLRCLRSTLSDSSSSTTEDTDAPSANSNHPYIPPPDYSSTHSSQPTASTRPPPPIYATLDPLSIRNILRIASNSQNRGPISKITSEAGTISREFGLRGISTVDSYDPETSIDSEMIRSNFRRSNSFSGSQLRRSLTSGIRRSARRFVENLRANALNQGILVPGYSGSERAHDSALNLTIQSEA